MGQTEWTTFLTRGAKSNVLSNSAVFEQGEVLKNKAHMPILNRFGRGINAVDVHLASLVRLLKSSNDSQERAFTTTGRPQQSHQRSGLHVEAEVPDSLLAAESLTNTADADSHGLSRDLV
jgi:hypothetical protein